MSKGRGDEGTWEPALPNFPYVATPEIQKMADDVRDRIEGFGIKGETFCATFYWVKKSCGGDCYFIQVRLGQDLFTFVEVQAEKDGGKAELVKMQPSLHLSSKDSQCPLEPRKIPIPTPDPCLLGLGPCP